VGLTLRLWQDKKIPTRITSSPLVVKVLSVCYSPRAEALNRAWQAIRRRFILTALVLTSRNDGERRILQEELFAHPSREKSLVCLHTMWDGPTGHVVANPYSICSARNGSSPLCCNRILGESSKHLTSTYNAQSSIHHVEHKKNCDKAAKTIDEYPQKEEPHHARQRYR